MRSTGAAAVVAVLVVLFLPVLYVLSVGPAVFLHDRGILSPNATSALESFYFPLEWAASQSSAIEYPLNCYAELWSAPSAPVPPPVTTATVVPTPIPMPAPAYSIPPAAPIPAEADVAAEP